jgi:metal-dependent amidase/aminoacylase/carboxypeptidase family protein
MQQLKQLTLDLVERASAHSGVHAEVCWHDPFRAGINDARATEYIHRAAQQSDAVIFPMETPMRWSEDFSEFTARWPGALFGLGAGEKCAQLHHPDYDFPDALLSIGVRMFLELIEQSLG